MPNTETREDEYEQDAYSRGADQLPPGEDGADGNAVGESDEERLERERANQDNFLISKAREIYSTSTDYYNANLADKWERNLAHFHSEHAPGTPYRGQNFRRSRTFRPKTRANVKQQEAGMAVAAFSTTDLLDIKPRDARDKNGAVGAAVSKALLHYRLENTVPWFLTVQGAFQDTKVYGICITHQYWKYHEDSDFEIAFDDAGAPIMGEDEEGSPVPMGTKKTVIRLDEPACDNVAPENFRFDPNCDWRRPADSSPYIVWLNPMYAGDVMEYMEKVDAKTGQPLWRKYELAEILAARRDEFNRVRQAREGQGRTDPVDENEGNELTVVWAHLNIVRIDGADMAYWTLGTELVLTDMMPLQQMYPHLRRGERPFTVGFSSIETHKNNPAGDVEQGAPLQEEINSLANQRLDNVKLVLNKRYFVRRGSQADLDALIRNVPGGGVMMNDPEKDVKVVDTRDVTASSYQEQDRLSIDLDELLGGFNQSTVANNKNVGKVSGVADQMHQTASAVQDYGIKIFIETWMEPTLRQLLRMEQMYETDEVVLGIAAAEAEMFERFGTDAVTDEMLRMDLKLRVDVGPGNTDPVKRVEKLIFGVSNVAQLPGIAPRLKSIEVANEVFGALGFRDSSRFVMTDDEVAEHEQKNGPPPPPPEIEVKLKELDIRAEDNKMRDAREIAKLELERELGYAKIALDKGMKLEQMYTQLGIEQSRNKTMRDVAATNAFLKSQEINTKRVQAAQPKPAPAAPGKKPPPKGNP
jgi:hypothetical protein